MENFFFWRNLNCASHSFLNLLYNRSAALASTSCQPVHQPEPMHGIIKRTGLCSPAWISTPRWVRDRNFSECGLFLFLWSGRNLAVSRVIWNGWARSKALKSFSKPCPTTTLPSMISATSFCTTSNSGAAHGPAGYPTVLDCILELMTSYHPQDRRAGCR